MSKLLFTVETMYVAADLNLNGPATAPTVATRTGQPLGTVMWAIKTMTEARCVIQEQEHTYRIDRERLNEQLAAKAFELGLI